MRPAGMFLAVAGLVLLVGGVLTLVEGLARKQERPRDVGALCTLAGLVVIMIGIGLG